MRAWGQRAGLAMPTPWSSRCSSGRRPWRSVTTRARHRRPTTTTRSDRDDAGAGARAVRPRRHRPANDMPARPRVRGVTGAARGAADAHADGHAVDRTGEPPDRQPRRLRLHARRRVGWAECKQQHQWSRRLRHHPHRVRAHRRLGRRSARRSTFAASCTPPNGDFDCAARPEACTIGAAKIRRSDPACGAPLSFDPTAPLPPPPTLLAGPLTDLRRRRLGRALRRRLRPERSGRDRAVLDPASRPARRCSTSADANGGFITLVQVRRSSRRRPSAAPTAPTRRAPASSRRSRSADYDFEAQSPLDFDPSGPLPGRRGDGHARHGPAPLPVGHASRDRASPPAIHPGVQLVQCTTASTSYEDCSQSPSTDFAPTTPAGPSRPR